MQRDPLETQALSDLRDQLVRRAIPVPLDLLATRDLLALLEQRVLPATPDPQDQRDRKAT